DLDGRPIKDADSRVRVQARQTFSFVLANQLNWRRDRSEDLARMGVATLLTACRREDGLFGRRFAPGRGLVDETADLYDAAFSLLAVSAAAKQLGDPNHVAAAREIAEAVESHLARPHEEGGYCEHLPVPERREQNPHMHYLEACLAHFEAGGGGEAMERVRRIQSLMETCFRDADSGALRETFTPDWRSWSDDRYEAGHQYEWVWLLAETARLSGASLSPASDALYAAALRFTDEDGRIRLSHTLEGDIREDVRRTWSLTEALKAHIARLEAGDENAPVRAAQTFDLIWDDHLAPAIEGGWIDKYDEAGEPISTDMPASTGYHLYLAFDELIRIAG
ncbi:MAG: AGE family epimerase/isomerase, partial [Pseudomonadota bacterium]